jgi:fermentation-respiration switch protein FrsA (DUF1100 family)
VVDYSLGEDVYKRLKDPKEFWKISGGKHTDVFFNNNGSYQKTFLNWLDKNIPKAKK